MSKFFQGTIVGAIATGAGVYVCTKTKIGRQAVKWANDNVVNPILDKCKKKDKGPVEKVAEEVKEAAEKVAEKVEDAVEETKE